MRPLQPSAARSYDLAASSSVAKPPRYTWRPFSHRDASQRYVALRMHPHKGELNQFFGFTTVDGDSEQLSGTHLWHETPLYELFGAGWAAALKTRESLLAGEAAGEGDADWEEGSLTGCALRTIGLRLLGLRVAAWAIPVLRRPPLRECSPKGTGCRGGVA